MNDKVFGYRINLAKVKPDSHPVFICAIEFDVKLGRAASP